MYTQTHVSVCTHRHMCLCVHNVMCLCQASQSKLGLAHPWLMSLFPPAKVEPSGTRYSDKRHDRQILERCKSKFLEMTRNSLFGLVRVYNFLPRQIVHCDTVKKFQKELIKMAKECCRSGSDIWTIMFSPRHVRQG